MKLIVAYRRPPPTRWEDDDVDGNGDYNNVEAHCRLSRWIIEVDFPGGGVMIKMGMVI